MVVLLDSIAAARPALSGAVLLARNADRAADARRALPKAEAVVLGVVETDVPLRPIPPHSRGSTHVGTEETGAQWTRVDRVCARSGQLVRDIAHAGDIPNVVAQEEFVAIRARSRSCMLHHDRVGDDRGAQDDVARPVEKIDRQILEETFKIFEAFHGRFPLFSIA